MLDIVIVASILRNCIMKIEFPDFSLTWTVPESLISNFVCAIEDFSDILVVWWFLELNCSCIVVKIRSCTLMINIEIEIVHLVHGLNWVFDAWMLGLLCCCNFAVKIILRIVVIVVVLWIWKLFHEWWTLVVNYWNSCWTNLKGFVSTFFFLLN